MFGHLLGLLSDATGVGGVLSLMICLGVFVWLGVLLVVIIGDTNESTLGWPWISFSLFFPFGGIIRVFGCSVLYFLHHWTSWLHLVVVLVIHFTNDTSVLVGYVSSRSRGVHAHFISNAIFNSNGGFCIFAHFVLQILFPPELNVIHCAIPIGYVLWCFKSLCIPYSIL